MNDKFELLFNAVENCKNEILAAERHIWNNPESGFREWKTHAYLKDIFEGMGYSIHEAGNIPGFYVDVETGKPGPKVAVFAELDSLIIPTHPECDPKTGAVHSCGHNCQCAALIGVAAALKAEGAFDGLCGSVRLIAVPAEEGIEYDYRRELKEKGIIRYFSGKLEFLHRGYLDTVDLAIMLHTKREPGISCTDGSNGSMSKMAIFKGRSAHAGASPHLGRNALYAATNALSVANALRETFREQDYIRFHPIITNGGTSPNAIPDWVVAEGLVRGATMGAIQDANNKINLSFAGVAAAMGCSLEIRDQHAYAPRINDHNLQEVFKEVSSHFFSEDEMRFHDAWGAGCSDMGDVSCVMPAVHPNIGGASGVGHSDNYYITDPISACVTSAKIQVGVIEKILSDNAAVAKKIIAEANVPYDSKEEYFKALETMSYNGEGVTYMEDGSVVLCYKK